MPTETESLQALNEIQQRLDQRTTTKSAVAIKGDLCQEYNKIKPWLTKALPLIERIPIYGRQIASALNFLMTVADTLCGI